MRTLTITTAIIAATAAWAQPQLPQADAGFRDELEAQEIDTIGCQFESWTITAAGTASVRLISPPGSDASPSALVVAGPTASGNTVSVRLSPTQGCGTAGCRAGKSYQVTIRPEAGSDRPVCTFRVDVRAMEFA